MNNLIGIMFGKFLSFVFVGFLISFNLYLLSKEEKTFANSILEEFINEQHLNSKILFTDVDWFYLEPTVFQESVSYFFCKGDINIFGGIKDDLFWKSFKHPKIINEILKRENAVLSASGSYSIKEGSFDFNVNYAVFSLSSEKFVLLIMR